MKIYYGFTTLQARKYLKYYTAIRKFLIDEGHTLTRDWVPRMEKQLKENTDLHGSKEIYDATIKAVFDAKLIIIEDTVSNFSTGHVITLGIQRNIPTLVLSIRGEKKGEFSKSFIHGIKSDNLQISEYTLENYQEIIRAFINKYSEWYKKHRFHLVIDDVEKNYIDWAQNQYDNNATQIIRSAIREKLNADQNYTKYLGRKKVDI